MSLIAGIKIKFQQGYFQIIEDILFDYLVCIYKSSIRL
jgi:hypothetical protein